MLNARHGVTAARRLAEDRMRTDVVRRGVADAIVVVDDEGESWPVPRE
ncbi:hypothetical protein [Rhodococcus erythropolis]